MAYQYKSKALQQIAAQREDAIKGIVKEFMRVKEKAEILAGERGRSGDAAVRRKDFQAIAALKMSSAQSFSFSGVDAAEFNALQKDVAALYAAIRKISDLLGNANS